MYIDTATYWGPEWQFPARRVLTRQMGPAEYSDLSALPGEAATPDVLKNYEQRRNIAAALQLFRTEGYFTDASRRCSVSEVSETRAKAVLASLPRRAPLPKVAPDGDSGVLLVWEGPRRVLLTIDEKHLHCVVAPGTADVRYLDEIAFDGGELPAEITGVLNSLAA